MNPSSNSPKQRYAALIASGAVHDDTAQHAALEALERLYCQLQQDRPQRCQPQGLYLWGSVGRGKTFLMDLFVASLGPTICRRQHFHHFMATIHQQLKELAGQKNPLKLIARQLSRQTQVLCFDEFFVSDIGDAMLLGHLLQALLSDGVILVATSNTPPERLYWNGLQRERFLPAIQAIQAHTCNIHLSGTLDHREQVSGLNTHYFIEPDETAPRDELRRKLLEESGLSMKAGLASPLSIRVLGRPIRCLAVGDRVICFEFPDVCEGPRSHFDYIVTLRHHP